MTRFKKSHPKTFLILKSVYVSLLYCFQFIRLSIIGKTSVTRAERSLLKINPHKHDFNSKIKYKMAFDRDPKLAQFADKYMVRTYVENRVGGDYLSKLYGVLEDASDFKDVDVPNEFVLKATHGSGGSVIVSSQVEVSDVFSLGLGPNWARYLIRPDDLNLCLLHRLMSKWIKQSYYFNIGRDPEWAYKDIKPRIIIEELFTDPRGGLPSDFKFFMFNGECQSIQVDSNRFSNHSRDFYDPEWNLQPFAFGYPNSNQVLSRPDNLTEMLFVARELSLGCDFVRIDLYITKEGIKFGEMTNYPGAGSEKISPLEWNYKLGSHWTPTYPQLQSQF